MINQDIAVDRSEVGIHSEVFDFDGILDLTGDELFFFRIDDKVVPVLVKRSVMNGGSTDEIEIDENANTVTVKLTQSEKSSLPDAGLNYKLLLELDVQAYGNVNASGVPPSEDEDPQPILLGFYNGDRVKTVTVNYTLTPDDDTINAKPGEAETITITLPTPDNLYNSSLKTSKEFTIINSGDGEVELLNAISSPHIIAAGTSQKVKAALAQADSPETVYWELV